MASAAAQDVPSAEPGQRLRSRAASSHDRQAIGPHLWPTFLCEEKGGSLAGRRVKRFTNLATANYKEKRSESKIKMADLRNHSLALRAIHDADVRFGILPSQSRFREDDEVKG